MENLRVWFLLFSLLGLSICTLWIVATKKENETLARKSCLVCLVISVVCAVLSFAVGDLFLGIGGALASVLCFRSIWGWVLFGDINSDSKPLIKISRG